MNLQDWMNPKNWSNRRRYLWAVTLFVMSTVVGAIVGTKFGVPATVAETVVVWGLMALMTFVATYVFGATWDHANIRSAITRQPSAAAGALTAPAAAPQDAPRPQE